MPATAVGKAKGSSIRPPIICLPGKEYLTKVHARISPKKQLITAAIKEHRMLVPKAFSTLESVIMAINVEGGSLKEQTRTDASGIIINIESIKIVIPRVSPNPGITFFRLLFLFPNNVFIRS